jgi:hypothetical protein
VWFLALRTGKDLLRLVAYGTVFNDNEKVNILRRVVLGLAAMGLQEVFFMPDYFGIGPFKNIKFQILELKK